MCAYRSRFYKKPSIVPPFLGFASVIPVIPLTTDIEQEIKILFQNTVDLIIYLHKITKLMYFPVPTYLVDQETVNHYKMEEIKKYTKGNSGHALSNLAVHISSRDDDSQLIALLDKFSIPHYFQIRIGKVLVAIDSCKKLYNEAQISHLINFEVFLRAVLLHEHTHAVIFEDFSRNKIQRRDSFEFLAVSESIAVWSTLQYFNDYKKNIDIYNLIYQDANYRQLQSWPYHAGIILDKLVTKNGINAYWDLLNVFRQNKVDEAYNMLI